MQPISIKEDKKLHDHAYTKTAWRLLPFLMICYLCAYLDRVNVGFAKLQMMDDLGFSETAYGLGAGMFFIGYFLFEVPSNILLHKIGARVWIARIMITWGILSGLFAFIETAWQFYALRFLLGIAEAGLAPGVLLYLTYWFPSHRRAKMTVLWFVAIPLSGMLGAPLSGWIMETFHDFHGWDGWQWMFIIEAIPTLVIGILVLIWLCDRIDDAKWLTEAEKDAIKTDLKADSAMKTEHGSIKSFISDKRLWILAAIYFCVVMGQYAITFWLPTIIKNTGVKDSFHIGLITSVPYIAAIICMLLAGRSGDYFRERRWHLAIPMIAGAISLFISTFVTSALVPSVIFLAISAAGILAASSLFWMLPTNLLGGVTAAAGIAAINSFANLAGFFSPSLIGWITTKNNSNELGLYIITAVLLLGALLVFTIPAKLVNR